MPPWHQYVRKDVDNALLGKFTVPPGTSDTWKLKLASTYIALNGGRYTASHLVDTLTGLSEGHRVCFGRRR